MSAKPKGRSAERWRSALRERLGRHTGATPVLGKEVYIASGAVVTGDVTLGDRSSVWHNAVLRGDINRILVGRSTNIQDNAVLHLSSVAPCRLGDYVTVGHGAIVHACTVADEVLIGMGAVILDGAVVEPNCLVGAGTLVAQGTRIPEGSLVLGVPGRVVRRLSSTERRGLRRSAEEYAENAAFQLQVARRRGRS